MAHLYSAQTVEGFLSRSCREGHRDFWNLDDILVEEEFVPCSFKHNAKGLGYLNLMDSLASSTLTHKQRRYQLQHVKDLTLEAGVRIQLPMWLAMRLVERELVDALTPKFIGKEFIALLKAGCLNVTMRNISLYVYEAGIKICEVLTPAKSSSIVELLLQVFVDRFGCMVVNHS